MGFRCKLYFSSPAKLSRHLKDSNPFLPSLKHVDEKFFRAQRDYTTSDRKTRMLFTQLEPLDNKLAKKEVRERFKGTDERSAQGIASSLRPELRGYFLKIVLRGATDIDFVKTVLESLYLVQADEQQSVVWKARRIDLSAPLSVIAGIAGAGIGLGIGFFLGQFLKFAFVISPFFDPFGIIPGFVGAGMGYFIMRTIFGTYFRNQPPYEG